MAPLFRLPFGAERVPDEIAIRSTSTIRNRKKSRRAFRRAETPQAPPMDDGKQSKRSFRRTETAQTDRASRFTAGKIGSFLNLLKDVSPVGHIKPIKHNQDLGADDVKIAL